jgi:hypothetical protein
VNIKALLRVDDDFRTYVFAECEGGPCAPFARKPGAGPWQFETKKLQFPNKLNYYKWQGKIFPTPYEGLP